MTAHSFGREVGLVHKAIVTGRKVGADTSFWAALADSEKRFQEFMGVHRGTHEIVRRPQVINTDLLVPTNKVICFPTIRKQMTATAFATRDEDPWSPFEHRNLTVPLPEREKPSGRAQFRAHHPGENMTIAEMVKNAGGLEAVKDRHLTTQWQIRRTADAQAKGEDGPLLTNGYANLFFVSAPETEEGVAVVDVSWLAFFGGCWRVWARPLSSGDRWDRENRLFLRTEELAA